MTLRTRLYFLLTENLNDFVMLGHAFADNNTNNHKKQLPAEIPGMLLPILHQTLQSRNFVLIKKIGALYSHSLYHLFHYSAR